MKLYTLFTYTLALSLTLVSCKARNSESRLQGDTSLGSFGTVDLSQYKDADDTVFTKMRQELARYGVDYGAAVNAVGDKYKQVPGMHLDEAVALHVYTGDKMYSSINSALRSDGAADNQSIAGTVLAAASGLNKIPVTSCTATRGAKLPNQVLQKLSLRKSIYTERGFMSFTSGQTPAAPFDRQPHYVRTTSSNCRSIRFLSAYPQEDEYLFAPGSEFLIVWATQNQQGKMLYAVEHLSTVNVVAKSGLTQPTENTVRADFTNSYFKMKVGNSLKFYSNGTGEYFDPNNNRRSPFSWSHDQTSQVITVAFSLGSTETLEWQYIILSRNEIQYVKANGSRGGVLKRQ